MAYIEVTATTTSSITARLNGLDTSYSGAARTAYWYCSSSASAVPVASDLAATQTLGNQIAAGNTVTVTGRSADSTYYLRAVVNNGTDTWDIKLDAKGRRAAATTASSGGGGGGGSTTTVAQWDWQSSELNRNAKKALYGELPAAYFDSGVWNALVDKIREVQIALGLPWLTYYAAEAKTMAPVGASFSAVMFNSALYNIHQHNSGSMNLGNDLYYVSRGDRIYGKLVINLARLLNMWIVVQDLDSGPVIT